MIIKVTAGIAEPRPLGTRMYCSPPAMQLMMPPREPSPC
jgi:hypothetical protein